MFNYITLYFRRRQFIKDKRRVCEWIYRSELEYWNMALANGDIPPDQNSAHDLATMTTAMKLRDWERINKKYY